MKAPRLQSILAVLSLCVVTALVHPGAKALAAGKPTASVQGQVGGSQEFVFELDAYDYVKAPIAFRRNKPAAVAAFAVDEHFDVAPIQITIVDWRGKVVAHDTDMGNTCLAAFVPNSTRLYHVFVSNPNDFPVAVFLWTND